MQLKLSSSPTYRKSGRGQQPPGAFEQNRMYMRWVSGFLMKRHVISAINKLRTADNMLQTPAVSKLSDVKKTQITIRKKKRYIFQTTHLLFLNEEICSFLHNFDVLVLVLMKMFFIFTQYFITSHSVNFSPFYSDWNVI